MLILNFQRYRRDRRSTYRVPRCVTARDKSIGRHVTVPDDAKQSEGGTWRPPRTTAVPKIDQIEQEISDCDKELIEAEPEDITLETLQKEASEEETTKAGDSLDAILSQFEGIRIGWMLEFLEEELLRLEEEKRMQAFYLIALNDRQKREAAEAGLRQKENLRRDEVQKLMTVANEVHRNQVNIFMENVIREEYDLVSEEKASAEIDTISKIITRESKLKLKDKGSSPDEADNLVNNFLIPEVYKRVERRKRQMTDKRCRDMMEEILDSILLKYYGVPGPTEEMYIIVISIIEDLLFKSMPIDEVSETSSEEDTARYEAKMAVKRILRTFMPKRTWMYSKERIADCTIDDVIQEVIEDLLDADYSRSRKNAGNLGSVADYVISAASVAGVSIEYYKEISQFNIATIESEGPSSGSSMNSSELFSCATTRKQNKMIAKDARKSLLRKSVVFRPSIVEADVKDMVSKDDGKIDFSSTDSDN